jgi:hypothetical protein
MPVNRTKRVLEEIIVSKEDSSSQATAHTENGELVVITIVVKGEVTYHTPIHVDAEKHLRELIDLATQILEAVDE